MKIYNVMQYGAKGDGKTNDAFSIQHAIDDCAKNGGGQVVFAPQITVQGNADRAVLESVLDDAQQRFELWYEQMMRRKARTAY